MDPWIDTLPRMAEYLRQEHPDWSLRKMERFVQSSANNFIEQQSYGCDRGTAYRTRQSSLDGAPMLARVLSLARRNGEPMPVPLTVCSAGSSVQAVILTTFVGVATSSR
jgi:hypothetical protein